MASYVPISESRKVAYPLNYCANQTILADIPPGIASRMQKVVTPAKTAGEKQGEFLRDASYPSQVKLPPVTCFTGSAGNKIKMHRPEAVEPACAAHTSVAAPKFRRCELATGLWLEVNRKNQER